MVHLDLESSKRKETQEKFARLWFDGLAKFHKIQEPSTWAFDNQHVIAYLRSKLASGMPSWKRLKIVEGLLWYRNYVRKSDSPKLEQLREKLRDVITEERKNADDAPIENVVGKINPREPDVIQALRRSMRVLGKAFNTEKAYVQKVRAFMADLALTNLADFDGIGAADVEAHLTDLAVDGDVAPSTQSQAFYALLFLFEHVLRRDFGKIDALRSTKAPRIPTVLSKTEVSKVLSSLSGVYLRSTTASPPVSRMGRVC